MFALIDTKNSTHIVINIPLEGAEKTIPALVGMLENNTKFISKTWSEIEVRNPEMSIQLGDRVSFEARESEVIILDPGSTNVIDDSFVLAEPSVLVSNKKAMESKDAEIARLRTELAHVKQQLQDAMDKLGEEE